MRDFVIPRGDLMKTLFLSATPSFLFGAARIGDVGGVFDVYNASSSPEEADSRAIHSDWSIVGEDIQRSMDEFEELHIAI